MATETLAVKYRPQKFEDLTEQKGIVSILQNQLKTKTVKNAYLFTGSAGTGKTTCARILAKLMNNGIGEPLELDAASYNSVEHIRSIIEQSKFRSFDGEYKIYIIDECHMLSNSAWNAMLKILEEPPELTIFIFCTTDPQKIPNTILSRVQRYDFQRISAKGIYTRLEYILKAEKLKYEKEAIEYISKFVDGGMRDAISLMEKCLAYSNPLTLKGSIEVIGGVPFEIMFDLLLSFAVKGEKESKFAVEKIRYLYEEGKDLKLVIKTFIQFILDIVKYKLTGKFDFIKIPPTLEKELKAVKLSRFDLLDILDSAVALQAQIKWEQQPLTLVELFVIKWTTEINKEERQ